MRYNLYNNCFRLFTNKYIILNFKMHKSKYLNVAEKNDAAKNIAKYLSRGTSNMREGLSKYNKIYEFEAEFKQQKYQMVMTSVSGHLLEYSFPPGFEWTKNCDPVTLFDANVIKNCPDKSIQIQRTLEREVRTCIGLIIWTDCDREGENIGFEIIDVCKKIKPNLQIYRAKFSEITSVSVHRALHNLAQPNKNISDAVDVRQELDLRIGCAFTRFQTVRLQNTFPDLRSGVVSYGSCQIPTLGFVVERYNARINFIKEPFWKIKVNHTLNGLSVDFLWDRVRLFDQNACQLIHIMCTENPQAKVINVLTKHKSKWRPLPLDTIQLEKLASTKLRINAKETMRIAEKLYTAGLISYPRTETNEYAKEINLEQLVRLQEGDPNWGAFARKVLADGPSPRRGNKNDGAHPPIHPTKHSDNLSGNEQRIYELVVRSFLACCSKDAQGEETTVSIEVANERFNASGLLITERNYLEVYPYDKWSSKEIHSYQTGQIFNPTSIDMVDGETSPPNLLTEADLIALMEKHCIGTDATHAEHIETIKVRQYAALVDGVHFVPTELGMGLVRGYRDMHLQLHTPHLRAQLEARLRDVCEGAIRPDLVLSEQIALYKSKFLKMQAEVRKLDDAIAQTLNVPATYNNINNNHNNSSPVTKCPVCESDMCVKQKQKNKNEFFIGCVSYPTCRGVFWLKPIVKSIEVLPESCPRCGPNNKKVKLEWSNTSVNHLYPPPYIGCIGGCDDMLNMVLGVVRTNSVPIANTTSSTNTNSTNNSRQTAQSNNSERNINQSTNRNRTFVPPPLARDSQARTPNSEAQTSGSNVVVCKCGQPAVDYTSRQQNENNGRKYYKCATKTCNFYQWGPPVDSTRNPFETPSSSEHSEREVPECQCGWVSVQKIVQGGPNKDRPYYTCSKPRSNKCNFFKWADQESSTGDRFTNNRGVRRGVSSGQTRGGARNTRRCTACRAPGHIRTNCPNNPST